MILSKVPLMDSTSFLSPTLSYDTTSSPHFPFQNLFFSIWEGEKSLIPHPCKCCEPSWITLCWDGQECFHSHKFQGNVDGNQTTNPDCHGSCFSLAQELGIPLNQSTENGEG